MGRVEFRRPWPPLQAPAFARTAARRDEPEATSYLPCGAATAAAVWNGMGGALRARPPLGHRSPPRMRRPLFVGGGGGAGQPVTLWLLVVAAVAPAGGIVSAATRGRSQLLKCG